MLEQRREMRKAARMAVLLEGATQHLDEQQGNFVDSRKGHSRTQHGSVIEISVRDQHVSDHYARRNSKS